MTELPHIKRAVFIKQYVDKQTFNSIFYQHLLSIEIAHSSITENHINNGLEYIRFIYDKENWYMDIKPRKIYLKINSYVIHLSNIIDYNKPDGVQRNFSKKNNK